MGIHLLDVCIPLTTVGKIIKHTVINFQEKKRIYKNTKHDLNKVIKLKINQWNKKGKLPQSNI